MLLGIDYMLNEEKFRETENNYEWFQYLYI